MKKFDADYDLLDSTYRDGYFPDFLVDKVKELVENVITFLETGERDSEEIQSKFDEMTLAINDLQEEFEERKRRTVDVWITRLLSIAAIIISVIALFRS